MSHVASPHGRHRSTVRRAERYAAVKALKDEGLTNNEIARRLGIGSTYVSGLLHDPDGSKAKARKWRNGGTCIDCDGPTYGGDGTPPLRCASCAAAYQRSLKVWTREAVIDAIQSWAAEHGRPPTANDWRRADPTRRYPAASNVYRRQGARRNAPFATWAEAVEAAGFPRPRQGQRPGENWWTREKIIAACRRWVAEHGDVPGMNDWSHAAAEYPSAHTAAYYFGTWNAMIEAAGFAPRRPGQRGPSRQRVAA